MGTRVLLQYLKQIGEPTPLPTPHSRNGPISSKIFADVSDNIEEMEPAAHASYNIPKESCLLSSSNFITGAGAIIFHRKSKRVVLVTDEREDQRWLGWFLPKGRKDIGESLGEAAVREGEEESGYPCRLLPVPVPTHAPKKFKDGNTLCTEPIYMHNWAIPSKRSWPLGGIYSVFYYVCEVTDEDLEKVESAKQARLKATNKAQESLAASQGGNGKVFLDYHELRYRAELFSYDTAAKLISESADSTVFGCALLTAIDLVKRLDEMEERERERARKAEKEAARKDQV